MNIIQTRFRDINPLEIFILLDRESYDAHSEFILNLNKIKDFHKGPFKLYVAKIEKDSTFEELQDYNIICRLITDKNEVPKYAVDNIRVKKDTDFLKALSDFIYNVYDADLKSLRELIKKEGLYDEEKEIFEDILHLFMHKKNSLPERDDESSLACNLFAKGVDIFNPYQRIRSTAHSTVKSSRDQSILKKCESPKIHEDKIRKDKELQERIESNYDSPMYIKKSGIKIDKIFKKVNNDNINNDDLTIELKKTERNGRIQYKIEFSFGGVRKFCNLCEGNQTFVYVICLLFTKMGLHFRYPNLIWNEQDYKRLINEDPKLKWFNRLNNKMFKNLNDERRDFRRRILSLGSVTGGNTYHYNRVKTQCNGKIAELLQEHSVSLSDHAKIAIDSSQGTYYIPVPAENIIIPKDFESLARDIPEEMRRNFRRDRGIEL